MSYNINTRYRHRHHTHEVVVIILHKVYRRTHTRVALKCSFVLCTSLNMIHPSMWKPCLQLPQRRQQKCLYVCEDKQRTAMKLPPTHHVYNSAAIAVIA